MREIDVQTLQEEMQVGYWELVNGEDTVYRDSRGNVYDSWGCLERLRELEMMMEEEPQRAEEWKRDMDLLEHTCEMKPVYGYCRISEKEARILRDRTEELVYYNPIRDIYVLGVTEMGKISDCERLWGNL